ncbi:DMBTL-like protein [Mya arenaria]|uniref:DMBTL-like protein n=1 Tax=Mya arenaria TaxID=6604 RepID=A0ABY7FP88_MYAAR|nr:DMBTL-like protein [Mya arenaria]
MAISNVRLEEGSGRYEGRVEVSIAGIWGTICEDGFDMNDAKVICRMLNMTATGFLHQARRGEGSGPIYLRNLECNGDETSINQCAYGTDVSVCTHSADVSVICSDCGAINVTNGQPASISSTGTSLTVSCKDRFNADTYTSDCKGGTWTNNPIFCRSSLSKSHTSDIVARIYPPIAAVYTLAAVVTTPISCRRKSNPIDVASTSFVCLSTTFAVTFRFVTVVQVSIFIAVYIDNPPPFPASRYLSCRTVFVTTTLMSVTSFAVRFVLLSNPMVVIHTPSSLSERNVHTKTQPLPTHCLCVLPKSMRLANGISLYDGRIELQVNGSWGTICGRSSLSSSTYYFLREEAEVICYSMFGKRSIISYHTWERPYGRGNGTTYIDQLRCNGNEDTILDCNYVLNSTCSHYYDAFVACNRFHSKVAGRLGSAQKSSSKNFHNDAPATGNPRHLRTDKVSQCGHPFVSPGDNEAEIGTSEEPSQASTGMSPGGHPFVSPGGNQAEIGTSEEPSQAWTGMSPGDQTVGSPGGNQAEFGT